MGSVGQTDRWSEKPSGTQIFFHISAPLSLGCKLLSSCHLIIARWLLHLLALYLGIRQAEGRKKERGVNMCERNRRFPEILSFHLLVSHWLDLTHIPASKNGVDFSWMMFCFYIVRGSVLKEDKGRWTFYRQLAVPITPYF